MNVSLTEFLFTSLRLSIPLILAGLGGFFSERAGIINISLEGNMLLGAFFSAVIAHQTQNPLLGLLAGIISGIIFSSLHGYFCIYKKADAILSGISLNLLAAGLTTVLCKVFYNVTSSTPMLETNERLSACFIGFSPMLIITFISVFLSYFVYAQTRFGQHLRFAGSHPKALESQGIKPQSIQIKSVLITGLLCGLAGSYLAIDHGSGFTRNMTSGRGFIALAALIVGRWTPHGTFLAAIAFGTIEASQISLQNHLTALPVQWIQMLPYVATLILLAGLPKRHYP